MKRTGTIATKRLVRAAILSALIIVMTVTPYTGYISYGGIEITTLHMPVILGAVLLGWQYGAALGLLWGLTCLVRAYAMPIYLPFGFGNPLISVLPRVIVGIVAGFSFQWVKRSGLHRTISISLATILATLVNTVLVLTAMSIYCQNTIADTFRTILMTIIGVNGTIEVVAAAILVPVVYFALIPKENILGIDIGATNQKFALMRGRHCVKTLMVSGKESLDSALDAFDITGVDRICITGVGASYIKGDIRGIPTTRADEFHSLCRGVTAMTRNTNCIIASVGTGTSFVRVTPLHSVHIGGTGVGGGMVKGLAKALCDTDDIDKLSELAKQGSSAGVDLLLKDVCGGTISNLGPETTVANLTKLATASPADRAYGIFNLVFQTIGVMAALAAKRQLTRTIVVTGTITQYQRYHEILEGVGKLHGMKFIVPENPAFIVAIGAARSVR